MLKKLKLIQKIGLLASVIIIISLVIQGMLLLNFRKLSLDDAASNVTNITKDFSMAITQDIGKIESNVAQLSRDLSHLTVAKNISRGEAIALLKSRLADNPDVVAMGIGFESNAFDQNDSAFKNQIQLGSDANGRFLAYVSRSDSSNGKVEPLTGYDVSGAGDWYLVPKATGKPIVTEPYPYTVNGKEIMMFTIAYPIQDPQGKFLGVLTADIALDQMQAKFESNEGLNNAQALAMLFTDKGQVLSSTVNAADVNAMKADDPVIQYVLKNEPDRVYPIDNLKTQDKYMAFASDVTFQTGDKWHLLSAIPDAVILKTYHENQLKTLLMIAGSLILIGILLVLITRSINQPIKQLMRIMKKVEHGDLSESARIDSSDEIGQLSASFDKMLDSLRHLINEVQTTSTVVENSSEHLSDLALQNAESIGEVNTIVSQIAEANVRQAEDIESILNRTALLGDKINETSEVIEELDQIAVHTNEISNQGVSTLSDLDKKSNETRALSEEISKAVTDVNATISNIDSIAMLIDNIASQTNLLALNASIEAARAGEAGRGFSVVADEIRSLAEQTTTATKDIKQLISVILSKSSVAVKSVSAVSAAQESEFKVIHESIDIFNEIIAAFRSISEQITAVKANSGVIESSKNEILDALTNISALTEETTASTEEVTATMGEQKEAMDQLSHQSAQLSQLTEALKGQVASFRV